ncbi:DNA-directed RNA polymerase subunit P [Candidatus Bathyarchaeota archaeon]|nr:MAG: DNA-directed RNA polymerase subunit P [Candidatus Bathyarchaeota archaeon]
MKIKTLTVYFLAEIKVEYQCIRCNKKFTYDELSMMPELKCPKCGYRILKKIRPPVVKHIKAR